MRGSAGNKKRRSMRVVCAPCPLRLSSPMKDGRARRQTSPRGRQREANAAPPRGIFSRRRLTGTTARVEHWLLAEVPGLFGANAGRHTAVGDTAVEVLAAVRVHIRRIGVRGELLHPPTRTTK